MMMDSISLGLSPRKNHAIMLLTKYDNNEFDDDDEWEEISQLTFPGSGVSHGSTPP